MSSETGSRAGRRMPIGHAFKVALSAGAVFYLLMQIPVSEILAVLRGVHWGWMAAGFALFLISFALRALRWSALLRGWRVCTRLHELLIWYLAGSFFNSVLPTGFGGDVLRVYELSRQMRDPVLATNSVVVDRYLGFMVLLGMGLVAVPGAPATLDERVLLVLAGLFFAGLGAGLLLFNPGLWRRMALRVPIVGRLLEKKAGTLATGVYPLRAIAGATAVSAIFNASLIACTVLIGLAVNVHIPLRYYLLFIPISSASLMVPSVGGLGVRELSYVALFPLAGVSTAAAVSMSLILYIFTVASGVLGGVFYGAGAVGELLGRRRLAPSADGPVGDSSSDQGAVGE